MAKRQVVYEEIVFSNYQDAVKTKRNAEKQIQGIESTQMIAIISTVCFFVGMVVPVIGGLLVLASFVLACICYSKTKSFGDAFRWGVNCAKWGWLLCPIFPFDLMIGFFGFFMGMYVFFFVPSLALKGVRKRAEEEIFYAENYINDYQKQMVGFQS